MIITLEQFWMGRDASHAAELTPRIRERADETVRKANLLLAFAEADGVEPGIDQFTGTPVASGWRPIGINARTSNAAAKSRHISGEAVDLQDTPERALARWCLANRDALEEVGIWMERPQWTAGSLHNGEFFPDPWVHWQIVPPRSGTRIYIPSTADPLVAALPGELEAA